jgi:predicted transposase/invertase (TIGR01784 family)
MDDRELPTPHNNFFHYALSHAQAARDLIQTHLPASLVRLLDLNSLELQKDSFIDEDLRQIFSDLLYSVRLAEPNGKPIEGQIYLLFEHKSQSDPMTCFQLLRYVVRIWEHRLRNGQTLCPVFPLVIYHGQEEWLAARNLEELIGGPRAAFDYGVRMSYPVLDIARVPDESLASDPFLQSVLGLLKYSRRRDFEEKLEFLLQCLLKSGTIEIRPEHVEAVFIYISSVSRTIPMENLTMTIQKIFHTQVEPGSIADQYITRGRQEGRQEGKQEGRQEGRQEGIQEGLKKGQIQLIQTLQEILGLPPSDGSIFEDRTLEELQTIASELRQQLCDRK